MEFGHILMFIMTVLISSTGHVFIQTGGSVKLDIKNKTLLHFNRLVWMNDKAENIVRFVNESGGIKYYIYKDSVDVNNKTLSLTLKNVQKTDSGLYTAKTIREKTTSVAEHNVSVIDPVDFPVLKWNFTMISVDACIVNVSCSGHDHTISNSYHSNNCTPEEVTSFGIQTLALYCIENVVVCNYSNPVSWKNDTIEIHQLCPPHELVYSQIKYYKIWEQAQTENRPSTTYSTIGQHQKPSFASETDHTIYSTVCKSNSFSSALSVEETWV
uniref:Immunoglobulin V-set domain-containing protein n=1 Tax=Cyprinus carpio TaxID=7962 RepID=A0A8C1LNF0_CYPCA